MSSNDNVAMASYYRMLGTVYLESAKILNRDFMSRHQKVVGNRMAIPFYHIVSHAAELFLKCALLKRNVTVDELKRHPIRHSLNELLSKLIDKGVPISPNSILLVDILSQQHERHSLRYDVFSQDADPVYTPEPNDLFDLLEELMMAGRITTYGI